MPLEQLRQQLGSERVNCSALTGFCRVKQKDWVNREAPGSEQSLGSSVLAVSPVGDLASLAWLTKPYN